MTFLEVKDVTHHFFTEHDATTALENVNFSVEEGEFISFLGPSGCGKSTLLSLLAGLIDSTNGAIDFAQTVEIGYMLQQDFLFPWKTIEDNVALGLTLLKKEKREIVDELKVNVGLSWVGVIVGEFLVSSSGLGYLIISGFQVFNFTLVFLALLIIVVLATVMYKGVEFVERKVLKK